MQRACVFSGLFLLGAFRAVCAGVVLQILRRHEFFGQYGKVLQIVVNKNQGSVLLLLLLAAAGVSTLCMSVLVGLGVFCCLPVFGLLTRMLLLLLVMLARL